MHASTASSGISQAPPWTIREGRMDLEDSRELRADRKRRRVAKLENGKLGTARIELDEEVEDEERDAKDEEEGGEGEAAVGETAHGMNKTGRDHPKAGFGTR